MPLQFTSKQAAEDMALAAYNRALKLSGPGLWSLSNFTILDHSAHDCSLQNWTFAPNVIYPCCKFCIGLQVMGVGFTGSLASSRPKHGDHRYALQLAHFTKLEQWSC